MACLSHKSQNANYVGQQRAACVETKEQHELKTVGIYDMIMQGIGIGCIISSPPSFDPAAVVSDVPAGCHM